MNWNVLIQQLGWTLVHSTWQIAMVAAATSLTLRVARSAAADVRYSIAVIAISISVLLPVVTFFQLSDSTRSTTMQPEYESSDAVAKQTEYPAHALPAATDKPVDHGTSSDTASGILNLIARARQFVYQQFPMTFPFLVGVWLIGVGVYSLRFAGGIYRLRRYRMDGQVPLGHEWQVRFDSLCKKIGVKQAVKLISSNVVDTPIAIGIFRPLIIVPACVFLQIDAQQLESIIVHELIHIRRFDAVVNALQNAAEVLFFYHPGIRWISAAIRREREFATDEAVIEACQGDRVVYASALANLEAIRQSANMTVPSNAMAANGGNLMQRIKRILNKKTETSSANSAWSAGIAVGIISILLLALFSFSPSSVVNGQKRNDSDRKVAIGFVGIPPLDRSSDPPKDADSTARILIAKLQQYKVPAIGFLTGSQVSDGEKLFPVRANIVRLWRDAGLEIGIGGFKHLPFHDQPLDAYIANVEKNERVAKQILGEKNQTLRYFSYPYLYTRKNDDHQKFEAWLKDQGLTSVKYTIDNNEWMYSYAYDMARNDNDVNTMKEVRTAFIDYMTRMFEHYEAYSKDMFGRDIPETMVLTPSRLVADSADDLFAMIKTRGYKFVSMDEAMADEAFSTPENYSGDNGVSWFDRWTLTAGKRLRNEPAVDANVQKIWDAKKK